MFTKFKYIKPVVPEYRVNEYSGIWALGLEMEATYILDPMTFEYKKFAVLDIEHIMDRIEKKKYKKDKYPYIVEAEQSGRTCGGVTILKSDPPKSMLEIATTTPYSKLPEIYIMPDITDYVTRLIEIQKRAIRDLNEFVQKEYNVSYKIVPYPFSMTTHMINGYKYIKKQKTTPQKNYTGSYHVTMTIPFSPTEINTDIYYERYKRFIHQFQWLEPLIIALYTTLDMEVIGTTKRLPRASYRIMMIGWGNPGGSDIRKFEEGFTRKVNIPLYWRDNLYFDGITKLNRACMDERKHYAGIDKKRNIYDMGTDFRTPLTKDEKDWKFKNLPPEFYYGAEMRILDYFPPKYLYSLIRVIAYLMVNSRSIPPEDYVYKNKDWIETMENVFLFGWKGKVSSKYVSLLEKNLKVRLKKVQSIVEVWKSLLHALYEKHKDSDYIALLLPNKFDGTKHYEKQPPLEFVNVNRRAWEFGFLFKLNRSETLQRKFKKLLQHIKPEYTLEEWKKYVLKHMGMSWKYDTIDLFHYLGKVEKDTMKVNKKHLLSYFSNLPTLLSRYI